MAPIKVDPDKVREFPDAESFYAWLGENHASEREVWIKIHKVGSGLASITPKEAIDVVLCFGWIDAVRKSLDEKSFLQRYTPRSRKRLKRVLIAKNKLIFVAAAPRPTTASTRPVNDAATMPNVNV